MLDSANTLITDLLGPLGPILLIGFLGAVMIIATLPVILRPPKDPLDRLKVQQESMASRTDALRKASGKDKLEKYSHFLEPQNMEEYSSVQLKLLQAGYRAKNAVRVYHFAQFALGIGGLILGTAYVVWATRIAPMSSTNMMLWGLGPGLAGYMVPKYWVNRRQQTRKQEITNGFPDSLDMMLVCVEAGQSLDQAILRVAKELRSGFPDLADEYELVSYEVKAGKDKVQVLRDMAERCGVSDISSFVTVLIQSQQFGTSIAEALRVYASEMRDKRVMRAEEKANTLPTKMTLATMMLTVPPLLIILIGPSVYDIVVLLGGNGAEEVESRSE
jgi:tight adherence protein C